MEKLVRRPNAVILFISLSLLMMLTTGCQEIKLKAGIEAANKQCPIDMGETGKITSIVYDGENVVYTFYLNEEAANIMQNALINALARRALVISGMLRSMAARRIL